MRSRWLSFPSFLLFACLCLFAAIAHAKDEPRNISVVDYVVEFDDLGGKSVQLSGWLLTMGDTVILYERMGSMNSVFVDISGLSSFARGTLMKKCGDGCKAKVIGKPTKVMGNKGIRLSSVVRPKIVDPLPASKGKKPAPKDGPVKVDVPTYIADYGSFRGTIVQIRGYLLSMGETLILYEKFGSMNAVFVDYSAMSSDDKKYILKRCGSGCTITLIGTPGNVMMNKGLLARTIKK